MCMIILSIQGTIMGTAAFIFGLLFMFGGISELKKSMIVKNTPTEKVSSASIGRTEIKGTAKKIDDLISKPFSSGDAILADWEIHEYNPSDEGSDWDLVDEGREFVNFYLKDDTGRIEVEPDKDSRWVLEKNKQTFGHHDERNEYIRNFCEKKDINMDKSERRRFTMKFLEPEDNTYILGGNVERDIDGIQSNNTDTVLRTKIKEDPGSGYFIISNKGEQSLSSTLKKKALIALFFGILFTVGGLGVLLTILL